jgi:hypothetical protein
VLVFFAGVAKADNPTMGSAKSPTLGQGAAQANTNQQKTNSFELIVTDIKVSPINTAAGLANNEPAASVNDKLHSADEAMKKLDHATTSLMVKNKLLEVEGIMKHNNDLFVEALWHQWVVKNQLKTLQDADEGGAVSDLDLQILWHHWREPSSDVEYSQQLVDLLFNRLYDYGVDFSVGKKTLETLDEEGCPDWLLEFIVQKMHERDKQERRRRALWHTNTPHHSANGAHHGTNKTHQKDKIHIPIVGD